MNVESGFSDENPEERHLYHQLTFPQEEIAPSFPQKVLHMFGVKTLGQGNTTELEGLLTQIKEINKAETLDEFLKSAIVPYRKEYQLCNKYVLKKIKKLFGKKGREHFLKAVDFTAPVDYLRVNALKTHKKFVSDNFNSNGVMSWMPEWSFSIIIIVKMIPQHSYVAKMISTRHCIMLYEHQWEEFKVLRVGSLGSNPTSEINIEYCKYRKPITEADHEIPDENALTTFFSVQGVVNTFIVMALAPKEGEDALELCASNNSRTSHIGAIMMNTGSIIANALRNKDVKAIEKENRLCGVENCVVMSVTPEEMAQVKANTFHRILVDAPGSGVGVVPLDSSSLVCKNGLDILSCTKVQKDYLSCGAACLKEDLYRDSFMLYTTSSLLVEENECVVDFILQKFPKLKLIPTGIEIGEPGRKSCEDQQFDSRMHYTRRIPCHQSQVDGIFLAKFMLAGLSERKKAERVKTFHNMHLKNYLTASEKDFS